MLGARVHRRLLTGAITGVGVVIGFALTGAYEARDPGIATYVGGALAGVALPAMLGGAFSRTDRLFARGLAGAWLTMLGLETFGVIGAVVCAALGIAGVATTPADVRGLQRWTTQTRRQLADVFGISHRPTREER